MQENNDVASAVDFLMIELVQLSNRIKYSRFPTFLTAFLNGRRNNFIY